MNQICSCLLSSAEKGGGRGRFFCCRGSVVPITVKGPSGVVRREKGIQMEGILLTASSLCGEAAGSSRPDRLAVASASQVGLEGVPWNELVLTQCPTSYQTFKYATI